MEAFAALDLIRCHQVRQFLLLLARVRRDRQRAETLHVEAANALNVALQHIQRRRLNEQTLLHREIGRTILQLTSDLHHVLRDLCAAALRLHGAALLLLALFQLVETVHRLQVVVDPVLRHPRHRVKQHGRDLIVEVRRDLVDAPKLREVILR